MNYYEILSVEKSVSNAAKRKLFGGLGWLVVGVIALIISYSVATTGSTYTTFTVVIIGGIIGLIVCIFRSVKINRIRTEFEKEFWDSI